MKPHIVTQRRVKFTKVLWSTRILIFLLALAIHPISLAKERFYWRNFLNPIHLNLSLGCGANFYENTLANMIIFEKEGKHYLAGSGVDNTFYVVGWMGKPYVRLKTYDNIEELLKDKGTNKTVLKGKGLIFPIALSAHIDLLKKLRLELGGSLLVNQVKKITPDTTHKHLSAYCDPLGKYYILRPFALLGFKVLENSAYTVLMNTQVSFDFVYANLGDKMATHSTDFPAVGLGFTVEKHISEYFSLFSRMLYETRDFIVQIVESKGVISSQQGIYLQLGITLNCPEVPRCSIEQCEVESKHKHGNKSYRGTSLFTGKDTKGYRLYEK